MNLRAEKVPPFDLRKMHRVLELTPEDMTVTVEAGCGLDALQKELAQHRQWLPIDPPTPSAVSIHDILSKDLSGPRRFGYGTIREHLIGMKVALADGRTIKSGGKVVKNVAGYDLAKLFIGAGDSLGIIVEATFKLRPLPEQERIVARRVDSIDGLKSIMTSVLDSDLTPVVLDTHRPDADEAKQISIVLGFAGTREEVEWQLKIANSLEFGEPTDLEYESRFWNNPGAVNRISALPSRLTEAIGRLGTRSFVARAGNGVVYYRGEKIAEKKAPPIELARRIKGAFDPKNILRELTA